MSRPRTSRTSGTARRSSSGLTVASRARGAWRLLREATGEARWDDYLAACRRDGVEPLSRREFERHRAHEKEQSPIARCC